MADPLKVLVVGGGMYVAGRGAPGYRGRVIPALMEARRAGQVGDIAIATTSVETAAAARTASERIAAETGVGGKFRCFPESSDDRQAYIAAARAVEPDAAIIVVPDHLHAGVTIPLLNRGIPCLVVKPLAGTLSDARRMRDAAAWAGVVAQVEFHKRLDESNLMMREKIRSDDLGTPLYATVEYSQRKTVPRDIFKGWASETSIFQYLGVHYVDLIGWATGFKPVRATAWGQKEYLSSHGIDSWDAIQAVIEWQRPDGGTFVSNFATNWIDPEGTGAMSDQRIIMVGTEGRYDADQARRGIRFTGAQGGAQNISPYFTGAWADDEGRLSFHGYGIGSVRRFLEDVIAVRAGTATVEALEKTRPSFTNCVASVAVIEAVHASIAKGNTPQPVEI